MCLKNSILAVLKAFELRTDREFRESEPHLMARNSATLQHWTWLMTVQKNHGHGLDLLLPFRKNKM